MHWSLDSEAVDNHWLFDFVLDDTRTCIHNIIPIGIRHNWVQTLEYPLNGDISIHRVYVDKYDRLHYFTFVDRETIERFIADRNIPDTCIEVRYNSSFPRARITKIRSSTGISRSFIYCLPEIYRL